MLQVEGKRLPDAPLRLGATPPLTLDLHGDWTLTGRQDLQSIPLAQVGKTPPTHLRGREGMGPYSNQASARSPVIGPSVSAVL
ncbi:hypothetical protein EYF80_044682 [Liparis tanakae]|uniref:Uncharacterized protein n=1 Tax=Liparis tanakae TaxID=230148 RepID=A0A4Z2FWH5_9TELE|nr:hypothetical protein EYF80_044682 [Liparis tanakae]